MLFSIILYNMLFIPLIYSKNTIPIKQDLINNKQSESLLDKVTKIPPMLTENGSALPDTSIYLHNSDTEMGKIKESTVKARKGAVYASAEDSRNVESVEKITQAKNINSTKANATVMVEVGQNVNNKSMTYKPLTSKLHDTMSINSTIANITEIHKPTKVSYEELAKAEAKSSSETVVNQLPTPNRGTKVYATANSHPGMVMPMVITILLVPMFAVLGYMALRRGREAWKNRHYKRMDFLLDGMYND